MNPVLDYRTTTLALIVKTISTYYFCRVHIYSCTLKYNFVNRVNRENLMINLIDGRITGIYFFPFRARKKEIKSRNFQNMSVIGNIFILILKVAMKLFKAVKYFKTL